MKTLDAALKNPGGGFLRGTVFVPELNTNDALYSPGIVVLSCAGYSGERGVFAIPNSKSVRGGL